MASWRIGVGFGFRLSIVLFVIALGMIADNECSSAQEAAEPARPTTVPLRPPPSPQERLLSPVPQQFDWMRRKPPSNTLLESIADLQRVESGLSFSLTLSGEYSDNFRGTDGGPEEVEAKENLRSSLTFGTIYRRERIREERTSSFLSLANTISASYDTIDESANIGFANLSLNTGYTWPRLSLALNDSLVLDDDRFTYTQGIESNRERFLSNSLSPQIRYAFSRLSSMTLGYTNDIVVNLEENKLDSVTHSITPRFEYRFSRVVTGNVSYTLSTVNRKLEGEDELSHNIAANLGWVVSARTNFFFRLDMLLIDRDANSSLGAMADKSRTVQLTAGLQRQLWPTWSLFVSVGPSYVSTTMQADGSENEASDILANWQVSLSGQIASQTSMALTTSQSIDNTSGDVADRGLVLRTSAGFTIDYTFTPDLRSTLFINYGRNDFLEEVNADTGSQSQKDQFIIAGVRGTYALTSVLSLSLSYQYEQRFSDDDAFAFEENRVTFALSSSF